MQLDLHRARCRIDRDGLVLRAVFDDARVRVGPHLLEQRRLGLHVGVGVEDEHLRAWLRRLEVAGDLAGAFVRAGRAAVRRLGDGDGVDAAVGHRFELLSQRECFRARLPCLQDRALLVRGLQARDAVPHQLDAGRHNELVVADRSSRCERGAFRRRVDARDGVLHDRHAVRAREAGVRRRQVRQRLAAADHEVGQRARDERIARLDHHDVDAVVGQQAHVLRRRRAAPAAADDEQTRLVGDAARRARGAAEGAGTGECGHQPLAPVHGFCSANQRANASTCASV